MPVIYVGLDSARTVKRELLELCWLIAESGLILEMLEFCGYSKRYSRTVLLIGPDHQRQQENNAKNLSPSLSNRVCNVFGKQAVHVYISTYLSLSGNLIEEIEENVNCITRKKYFCDTGVYIFQGFVKDR